MESPESYVSATSVEKDGNIVSCAVGGRHVYFDLVKSLERSV